MKKNKSDSKKEDAGPLGLKGKGKKNKVIFLFLKKTKQYSGVFAVLFFSFFFLCLTSFFDFKSLNNSSLIANSLTASLFKKTETINQGDIFLEAIKNTFNNDSEIIIIADNSIKAALPPALVKGRSLGIISDEEENEQRTNIIEYIVQPNDTLSSIAEKFNISIDTIVWANNLTSRKIRIGQELIILPVSGVLHIVEKGDTLSSIAKRYGAKIEDILVHNDEIEDNDIFVGDVLIVPGGKIIAKKGPVIKSVPVTDSYFIVPASGIISQGAHGLYGRAVDIANSCGKPVVAAAGGIVQRVGWDPIGGRFITILHSNGVVTYYGHLSAQVVSSGQAVGAGELIGYIGNSGYTIGRTGCHLHFETRGARNFLTKYPVGSKIGW